LVCWEHSGTEQGTPPFPEVRERWGTRLDLSMLPKGSKVKVCDAALPQLALAMRARSSCE